MDDSTTATADLSAADPITIPLHSRQIRPALTIRDGTGVGLCTASAALGPVVRVSDAGRCVHAGCWSLLSQICADKQRSIWALVACASGQEARQLNQSGPKPTLLHVLWIHEVPVPVVGSVGLVSR